MNIRCVEQNLSTRDFRRSRFCIGRFSFPPDIFTAVATLKRLNTTNILC